MSLRAEYSYAYVFNPQSGGYEVTAFHHPVKPRVVGRDVVPARDEVEQLAERLISDHMEKVTRSLGLGSRALVTPEEDAEQDRLAHKADHDNQCEKDLS
jgi:hypothetical protein